MSTIHHLADSHITEPPTTYTTTSTPRSATARRASSTPMRRPLLDRRHEDAVPLGIVAAAGSRRKRFA
jgi:hypothetical protein